MKDGSSDHIIYFQSSDGQVLWSSHHLFHLLALFSVIRGLAIAALLWMLDLWSSCQTVFVEMVFKMNKKFCCHLCCSTSTIYTHNPRWFLSLSFGFWPLFLLADDVLPWFVYVVITLETAALDIHNKVAILVTVAPAQHATTMSSSKILGSHFAVLSHELLLNTICNALTLAPHSTNKQKNKERNH